MKYRPTKTDCFGLVKPAVDAHTLGLSAVEQLLQECGFDVIVADPAASEAFGQPRQPGNAEAIESWIRKHRVTILGFSHRLGAEEAAAAFSTLMHQLKNRRLLPGQGGPLKAVCFAGLPRGCELVRARYPEVDAMFCGDETPTETLHLLGINPSLLPRSIVAGTAYDEMRLAFGGDLIQRGDYLAVRPVDRSGYPEFGTEFDTVVARMRHGREQRLPPLMRAHVGPFLDDRKEGVKLFLQWTRELAAAGLLDVLSIGTSQLTQSNFGEEWNGRPNGGGVPLNSPEEFAAVWEAARPMLVRTYAGTRDLPALAGVYENTIHNAWHTLSLWWFCLIDGRGPYSVKENLRQQLDTLRYVASMGKPFEPNVPHHFAFRGADDVTCVVSAVIAGRAAKSLGISHLILQIMLNTPKCTWGVQDLAKARAMLRLVRELEDGSFRVFLQPRAGLDYFSSDLSRARAQLAAATALMDDLEPHDPGSPPIIHVVGYSEASHLADPAVVNESIQITRHALERYRMLRVKGDVEDMAGHPEVFSRTEELVTEARALIRGIEASVPNVYSAEGLYAVLARGFLPVPYLWECKDEFKRAIQWQTRLLHGAVRVVDEGGNPMSVHQRLQRVTQR